MGLDLHIEALVLHGFAPRDRHRIAEAVELELARLLSADAQQDPARGCLTRARLDGGSFQVKAGASAQATGRQIAQALFRGLPRQSSNSSHPAPANLGVGQ